MSAKAMARRVGLDACVLINLVASGVELREIGEASDVIFCVTKVVAGETYSLHPSADGLERAVVDVEHLILGGHLESAVLSDSEISTYVSLATELDDGEASAIAASSARGWPVLTDDRRAGRVVARLGLELIGTPALMRGWEDALAIPAPEVGAALRLIETCARYTPRPDDPLRQWWADRVGRS